LSDLADKQTGLKNLGFLNKKKPNPVGFWGFGGVLLFFLDKQEK